MTARLWHGWTTTGNADAYQALLEHEIFVHICGRSIDGYLGIELFRRQVNDEVEFITLMRFESMEAVKAFAGEDYQKAVVPDKAKALLSQWDHDSQHYEFVENSGN